METTNHAIIELKSTACFNWSLFRTQAELSYQSKFSWYHFRKRNSTITGARTGCAVTTPTRGAGARGRGARAGLNTSGPSSSSSERPHPPANIGCKKVTWNSWQNRPQIYLLRNIALWQGGEWHSRPCQPLLTLSSLKSPRRQVGGTPGSGTPPAVWAGDQENIQVTTESRSNELHNCQ